MRIEFRQPSLPLQRLSRGKFQDAPRDLNLASSLDKIWIPRHLRRGSGEGVHALSEDWSGETESALYVARRVHEEKAIDRTSIRE